jgi:abequosyltransferase
MTILSICIPTFNRADYLRDCLHSIFHENDSLEEIEVCVSDNASTDNTIAVIKDFQNYNNFSYQRNEDNLGIPLNFIKVTSMASGRYIWLLGDDDVVTKDGIRLILNRIKDHSGVGFFFFSFFPPQKKNFDHLAGISKKKRILGRDFAGRGEVY